MVWKIARVIGLIAAVIILQQVGILLIQSPPSPYSWREVAGLIAIGLSWESIGAIQKVFTKTGPPKKRPTP